jgi:hypothetical protein
VDLKADPPTTVSELSKVLGVIDREGAPCRARLTKAKAAIRRRARAEGGVEPDVFRALVQREVDGSKLYVAVATKLRVRGCE